MTEHVVHITRDDAFLSRLAEYREPDDQDREDAWQEHIECTVPDGCGGWQECLEPHEVDGVSADDGPYDCEEGVPWEGRDEFEFHGVSHEWRWGHGWTVDFRGCPLAITEVELPDGIDTTRDGKWRVEDDWDGTDCYLVLIGEDKE